MHVIFCVDFRPHWESTDAISGWLNPDEPFRVKQEEEQYLPGKRKLPGVHQLAAHVIRKSSIPKHCEIVCRCTVLHHLTDSESFSEHPMTIPNMAEILPSGPSESYQGDRGQARLQSLPASCPGEIPEEDVARKPTWYPFALLWVLGFPTKTTQQPILYRY